MRLGQVLRKERERRGLTIEDTAIGLGLTAEEVVSLEGGSSQLEHWGPIPGRLAVALGTPTSRLLSPSGHPDGLRPGTVGSLVSAARQAAGLGHDELAELAGLTREEYAAIESGRSPLERLGPVLLRFAELVGVPVFNLFYPCGVPFFELDDYP